MLKGTRVRDGLVILHTCDTFPRQPPSILAPFLSHQSATNAAASRPRVQGELDHVFSNLSSNVGSGGMLSVPQPSSELPSLDTATSAAGAAASFASAPVSVYQLLLELDVRHGRLLAFLQ